MDKILVLDFGGQYNQLIARRVREHKIFAEVKGYNGITLDEIKAAGYTGIIFTGGPNSVYTKLRRTLIRRYFPPAFPFWASATDASSWRGWEAARSAPPEASASTAR